MGNENYDTPTLTSMFTMPRPHNVYYGYRETLSLEKMSTSCPTTIRKLPWRLKFPFEWNRNKFVTAHFCLTRYHALLISICLTRGNCMRIEYTRVHEYREWLQQKSLCCKTRILLFFSLSLSLLRYVVLLTSELMDELSSTLLLRWVKYLDTRIKSRRGN